MRHRLRGRARPGSQVPRRHCPPHARAGQHPVPRGPDARAVRRHLRGRRTRRRRTRDRGWRIRREGRLVRPDARARSEPQRVADAAHHVQRRVDARRVGAPLRHGPRHLRGVPQRHAHRQRPLQPRADAVQRHPPLSDLRRHEPRPQRPQRAGRDARRGLVERPPELRLDLEPLRRPAVAPRETGRHVRRWLLADGRDRRPDVEVLRQGPDRVRQPRLRRGLRRDTRARRGRLGHRDLRRPRVEGRGVGPPGRHGVRRRGDRLRRTTRHAAALRQALARRPDRRHGWRLPDPGRKEREGSTAGRLRLRPGPEHRRRAARPHRQRSQRPARHAAVRRDALPRPAGVGPERRHDHDRELSGPRSART